MLALKMRLPFLYKKTIELLVDIVKIYNYNIEVIIELLTTNSNIFNTKEAARQGLQVFLNGSGAFLFVFRDRTTALPVPIRPSGATSSTPTTKPASTPASTSAASTAKSCLAR